MPQPIAETLGTLPGGDVHRLSSDGLTQYLRTKYRTKSEDDRKRDAVKRLDLFRDRGREHFEKSLDSIFKNQKVRQWRKDFVALAEFQNLTKRIVNEKSTVYSQPAKREVRAADTRYQELQRRVRFDRRMRQVNRFGNLLNHCLVWPDVVDAMPLMRIVTTDKFTAVAHPNDPTRAVAFIVDQFPGGLNVKDSDPHYLLISDWEFIRLDKSWNVTGAPIEHGLGRMPALLWSREEPDDRILDATTGNDLISAHLSVALINTMMLKHQKSGTKLPYATGDTSQMANGQPMDEEHLLQAPEGVALSTLDLGADPRSYIDAARAVIKQIAANNGIPESVFDLSYQATSGFEIQLKRTGLRELRLEQILDFRPFEQDLAELWSTVIGKAGLDDLKFDTAGWSIDFGEVDTPQDPNARLEYWTKLEELGLVNRPWMYSQLNPEATEAEAVAAVEENIGSRVAVMLKFQRAGMSERGDMQQKPFDGGAAGPGADVSWVEGVLRGAA